MTKSKHGGAGRGQGRKPGVPIIPPEKKRIKFGCYLDPKTKQLLDSEAARLGLSLGKLIDKLVKEAINS